MSDEPFDQDQPTRDPAYWSELIDAFEDDAEAQPDAASLAAEDVSRMLGALRRLNGRVADYDLLHLAELARLDARRQELVGPVVRRIASIEATLRQYALRAHLDFGKTGTILATPNGSIKASRPLVSEVSIVDAVVAEWLRPLAPDAVFDHPKVGKADLRFHLEQGEANGLYQRAIVADKIVITHVDGPWALPFEDGWVGVWLRPEVEHDEPGGPNPGTFPGLGEIIQDHQVVAGVTWKPVGEQGCGRNFTINLG